MKRATLLFVKFLIITALAACNKDSGGSTDTGYVDPDFATAKTQAVKAYTLGSYSCSAQKSCGAVIYSGKLDKVAYIGIAAGRDAANPNFSLKIYWNAGSIPATLDTSSYTVLIKDGSRVYTTSSDNLNISIASGSDANSVAIYTITFNEPVIVSDSGSNTFTINSGDTIVAYKYPE